MKISGGWRINKIEFENFVAKYGDTLARLCFSLCRNESDASDLYQETWLKAYVSYDEGKIAQFDKWIYTICVNRFRDTYRKKLRSPQEIQFDTNEHKDAFMQMLSTEDAEYDRQDYQHLYEALDRLPEKLKIVVSLKYFSDMSCSEIADVLGVSLTAVTTRLSRAIQRLAAEMNAVKE